MNFEIYIYLEEKQAAFYKAAMAEYEKRLSRYCKLKAIYLKKEKDVERIIGEEECAYVLMSGDKQLSSEELSRWIGQEENTGTKKIVFLVIGPELLQKRREDLEEAKNVHKLSLSRFDMAAALEAVILEEQIYRAYRILHNHPYHK